MGLRRVLLRRRLVPGSVGGRDRRPSEPSPRRARREVKVITVGIWIWSRTAGLPIGPEAGEPEAIGADDLLATVLEALLVAWVVAVRAPTIGSRAAPGRLGTLATAVVWAAVVGMTAIVFFTGPQPMTH